MSDVSVTARMSFDDHKRLKSIAEEIEEREGVEISLASIIRLALTEFIEKWESE